MRRKLARGVSSPSSRSCRGRLGAFALCGSLLLSAAAAGAQTPPHELRFDPWLAAAVDVPLAGGYLALYLLADSPERCAICTPSVLDLWLSEGLSLPRGREAVAVVSDFGLYAVWAGGLGLAFAAGLAGPGGAGRSLRRGAEDLFAVAEAVLATQALTHSVKLLSARKRPETYLRLHRAYDSNQSFFSGHSSNSAAIAASAATVSHLRGYPFRTVVLAVGTVFSLTVGLLRVVALKHWASDVLVGWLVGAALGVALPLLLHPRLERREASDAATGGASERPLLRF
ncbi:MAG: phosphatase PAP2 family protein [Myxococcales bacterium]|nr:phosphatase PAP2 family protein [Myxococcales bacterium]